MFPFVYFFFKFFQVCYIVQVTSIVNSSLVKKILKYFILFDANVNDIAFVVSF